MWNEMYCEITKSVLVASSLKADERLHIYYRRVKGYMTRILVNLTSSHCHIENAFISHRYKQLRVSRYWFFLWSVCIRKTETWKLTGGLTTLKKPEEKPQSLIHRMKFYRYNRTVSQSVRTAKISKANFISTNIYF